MYQIPRATQIIRKVYIFSYRTPAALEVAINFEAKLSALATPARRTAVAADEKSEGAEVTETSDAPLTQPIPRNPTSQHHHFLSIDAALLRIMTAMSEEEGGGGAAVIPSFNKNAKINLKFEKKYELDVPRIRFLCSLNQAEFL